MLFVVLAAYAVVLGFGWLALWASQPDSVPPMKGWNGIYQTFIRHHSAKRVSRRPRNHHRGAFTSVGNSGPSRRAVKRALHLKAHNSSQLSNPGLGGIALLLAEGKHRELQLINALERIETAGREVISSHRAALKTLPERVMSMKASRLTRLVNRTRGEVFVLTPEVKAKRALKRARRAARAEYRRDLRIQAARRGERAARETERRKTLLKRAEAFERRQAARREAHWASKLSREIISRHNRKAFSSWAAERRAREEIISLTTGFSQPGSSVLTREDLIEQGLIRPCSNKERTDGELLSPRQVRKAEQAHFEWAYESAFDSMMERGITPSVMDGRNIDDDFLGDACDNCPDIPNEDQAHRLTKRQRNRRFFFLDPSNRQGRITQEVI